MKNTLERIKYILGEADEMHGLLRMHIDEALGEIKAGPSRCPAPIEDIERIFGKFDYTEGPNGTIKMDTKWLAENAALYYFKYGSVSYKFYLLKLVAPQFMGMVTEIHSAGLGEYFEIYENGGGVYSPRHKFHNPKSNLSKHCWPGCAFDNNPKKYPLGSQVKQPDEFVAIARKWGYYPGHLFKKPDPMHMEWCEFPI